MTAYVLWTMIQSEVRLRTRRISSIVAILAVVAITWMMIADPISGSVLISVGDARVVYNSLCLALGSSLLANLFFGLGGFYLVRGRMNDDFRSGCGSVLATMPISNSVFLIGRWLGAVAYLCVLILALLATILVLHLLRGEGPIQLLVYLKTYVIVFFPSVIFACSMALFCEAFAPLSGKAGDVAYFFVWMLQSTVPIVIADHGSVTSWTPAMIFDFSGVATSNLGFLAMFHTSHFSIGISDFDKTLPPVVLEGEFWSTTVVLTRIAGGVIAALPVLLAIALFHRFSPDKIKLSVRRQSWSLIGFANRLLRPLTKLTRPLFALAASLPGFTGQVVAELALSLASSPIMSAGLIFAILAGCTVGSALLGGFVLIVVAFWGVQISDLSVRDYQSDTESMTAVVMGGASMRYWRQIVASCLLGLLLTAPVIVRWAGHDMLRAVSLVSGIFAIAATANLLGRMTRTSRTFIALFLFGLYLATQIKDVPFLDVVGANGVATISSVVMQSLFGLIVSVFAYGYTRWRAA
ncbi:hypothetical protein AAKU61_000262 [Undibacterium sp. GrIS 1.2]|uniref:hypothetical protein n=1 Tax=Undibacterium sp. GrIS 1.2 TaxID=3143933 RepID=UPI003398758A